MNRSFQSLLAQERERIDRKWIERIERFAARLTEAWLKFDSLTDDLELAEWELDEEEFAPVFAAFKELLRLGIRFDPQFVIYMSRLEATGDRGDDDGYQEDHLEVANDTMAALRITTAKNIESAPRGVALQPSGSWKPLGYL